MIHCVKLCDVREWLNDIGYRFDHKTQDSEYWVRGDSFFMFPHGNVNDDMPEQTLLSIGIASEIDVPDFDVHWCD